MASAPLSRRVGKVVGYPPLSEMSEDQRREFHEALLEADAFDDLPGKWQAAILSAEENRPELRVVTGRLSYSAAQAHGMPTGVAARAGGPHTARSSYGPSLGNGGDCARHGAHHRGGRTSYCGRSRQTRT
jgi:hypothetical protein